MARLPGSGPERSPAICPTGPPAPPRDVTVQAGAAPATVRVSWQPPALTAPGLSSGASVLGYGVYAKGQRVSGTSGALAAAPPLSGAGEGLSGCRDACEHALFILTNRSSVFCDI